MITINTLMLALLLISIILFIIAVVKVDDASSVSSNSAYTAIMLLPFDLNLYFVHLAFNNISIIIALIFAFLLLLIEGIVIMAFTAPTY